MGMNIGIFLALSNEGRVLRQVCGGSYSASEPLLKPNGVNIYLDGEDALCAELAAHLCEVFKEGSVIVADKRVHAQFGEGGVVRFSYNGNAYGNHDSNVPVDELNEEPTCHK